MSTFDPRTVHTHPHHVGSAPQFGTGQFPGQQFPGPVPPPARPTRKLPLAAKILAGFVAVGLVAGGAGAYLAFSGGTAEAAVQSTSFAGANPTTSPFGTDAPQVAAVGATGPQSGDTAGLYAATTPPACTTADFLSQLQADPSKLAAFGGVFGLGATDVPAFVDSLSPVVLRANTSVTDHPFQDGAFVEQPAILAAGTAVLVNSYGEPTVKCFNGNPLTGGAPVADAISVIPTDQVITQLPASPRSTTPRVVVIPGKPDPKPHPGHNPDPFLQAKADAAQQLADNARKDATTARDRRHHGRRRPEDGPDRARRSRHGARHGAGGLNQAFRRLPARPRSGHRGPARHCRGPGTRQAKANQDLGKATTDAQAADKKAKDLEDKATADEQAAAKAKQDAEDSKHPHQKEDKDQDKPVEAKKVDPAATTGTEGQAAGTEGQTTGTEGQTAGTQAQTKQAPAAAKCPTVVADVATLPAGCTLPTGSADTATGTTPATSGTAATGGEKASTGSSSQGSSTGKSSSSSSSSTSGSTSSSKGGSDK